ncbi:MAG: HDIG domain-containing protein [Sedimentisphaerales bacterium]|nr:HDIG domain-containing protein [Sedimentisphaerales bacterium]
MALKKKKKISARRKLVRETISAERSTRLNLFLNSDLPVALMVLFLFVIVSTVVLSILPPGDRSSDKAFEGMWRPYPDMVALGVVVFFVSLGMALYLQHYQPRIITRPTRMMALACLFLLLLGLTKAGALYQKETYLATATAVTCAIILTIAYDQRFSLGMTLFYSILVCLAISGGKSTRIATVSHFITMAAGAVPCCFALREIRTRMKLIEVATIASVIVFVTAAAMGRLEDRVLADLIWNAAIAALVTIVVGVMIQSFLPLIEKVFGIATSMTLLDYSDANQPLLKKLAMEAPGTFSHSLLIGTIAEAAAEAIGANGLLCRVGAYYHDVGKINKPVYFGENQMGSASRHEQLSPAMSQLIIVGHVKDGIEIAREYGLPAPLRQFIETHHGTTLIEYFYNEARKKQTDRDTPISETEFRYPGPKPRTKEAAIVMLADCIESAVRSMTELTPTRIEVIVHNMVMKRLQDGQFDECDLTLRELSQIEAAIAKSLAAHHHGRVAYPQPPDKPAEKPKSETPLQETQKS